MQDAFGVVIFVVVIVGALVAVGTLVGRATLYEEIGKGGLEMVRPREESRAVAAAEIRQMVQASSDRRERRGEAPLDIDAEIARLTTPRPSDPALEAEVRSLVIARNARRARKGQEPLDVDAEVARQLADLSG